MKLQHTFIILLFIFCILSCNKEEYESLIKPSVSVIEMEGEGGVTEISFAGEEWIIAKVLNKNGN